MAIFPYFDTVPAPIAHRGFTFTKHDTDGILHSNGLENSMAAFQSAIDLGYRYIETDLHGSRDGVAVISHDPTLTRTTDHHGLIMDMNWDEIRQAKIGGIVPISRLEDLLGAWPDLRINLHLKNDAAARPVAEAINQYQAWDRVGLTSFSTERRKLAESYLTHLVAAGAGKGEMVEVAAASRLRSEAMMRRALDGVDCVQIPADPGAGPLHVGVVNAELVDLMHQAGKFVHVWTIDEPAEMQHLLDIGVDGIITNRADLLKQVLIERGQWH